MQRKPVIKPFRKNISIPHFDHQYRLGYLRELYWQDLTRGTQLIETKGHRLGQINAPSVIQYADVEFGLLTFDCIGLSRWR